MPVEVHESEWTGARSPEVLAARLWRAGGPIVLLQGDRTHSPSWVPRVAVQPRPVARISGPSVGDARKRLTRIDDRIRDRRRIGGTADTGVVVLLSHDWGVASMIGMSARDTGLPSIVAWEVDCSVRFAPPDPPRMVRRASPDGLPPPVPDAAMAGFADENPPPATARRARTSLPRERYVRGVETIREHIRHGDIYQANLTQRFEVESPGDPFDAYRRMVRATPAPRAAFVADRDVAVASVSPEPFLIADPGGRIETWPIKGTRRRGGNPRQDRRAAAELLSSDKDRAELIMIVDLERNDLGRVCETGSVRVDHLAALRTFAAVHHLVARVSGTLRREVGWLELLEATFPGGSVTGAPKRSAVEILARLEPVPRGFFTGSLFWLGDDGSMDSSILIRTASFARDTAWLGAGGGVVADSDPESEWQESIDKARAPAAALGFVPEEAE